MNLQTLKTRLFGAKLPEIEISDMETLSHFVGKLLTVHVPESGKSGRTVKGVLIECDNSYAIIEINGDEYGIDKTWFERDITILPVEKI